MLRRELDALDALRELAPFLRHTLGEVGDWPYEMSPMEVNPRLRAALAVVAAHEDSDA